MEFSEEKYVPTPTSYLYDPCDLKIRSRSQKSNHFLQSSLDDLSVPVWSKSGHWFRRQSADKAFLYDLDDFEYYVKVTKIKSFLKVPPIMYLCQFGQILASSSKDS